MTIAHEAFLFDPDRFAADLVTLLRDFHQAGESVEFLRTLALQMFDASKAARYVASQFGGWDRWTLSSELSGSSATSTEVARLWCLLFLYTHLEISTLGVNLGLIGEWEALQRLLQVAGWPERESKLLVRGRNFGELAGTSLQGAGLPVELVHAQVELWRHLKPDAIGGVLGWLDNDDVSRFSIELADLSATLPAVESHGPNATEAIRRAVTMLNEAHKAGSGLGFVIGG